uniref:Uncharacterized protein n=1 Tax=Siphoviridae sp. ctGfF74 TaxID=2826223 RepID=A0A8S5NJY4_9CAUD|nr:MAG TPA: hypothetical protein [Siphoviridae sp. ctGfF74]DAN01908.1 MAG TPA: hypothetical protein [Caudoviricetes sp.]
MKCPRGELRPLAPELAPTKSRLVDRLIVNLSTQKINIKREVNATK